MITALEEMAHKQPATGTPLKTDKQFHCPRYPPRKGSLEKIKGFQHALPLVE
jgi:hypothetical protein